MPRARTVVEIQGRSGGRASPAASTWHPAGELVRYSSLESDHAVVDGG